MADFGTWAGIALAVGTLAVAWLAYRSQSNRKQLEYVVLSTQPLVSPRVADELAVVFDGRAVVSPSVTVVRIVSTGDKGIPADTYEAPLTMTLDGAQEIVSVSVSAVRPRDLPIVLTTEGNHAHIEPLLLNPGDFIEIQALAAGVPHTVSIEARIADVSPSRRASLPSYPPGSGPEGQMLGFDKFMWSVPEIALAVLAYVGIIASRSRSPRRSLGQQS